MRGALVTGAWTTARAGVVARDLDARAAFLDGRWLARTRRLASELTRSRRKSRTRTGASSSSTTRTSTPTRARRSRSTRSESFSKSRRPSRFSAIDRAGSGTTRGATDQEVSASGPVSRPATESVKLTPLTSHSLLPPPLCRVWRRAERVLRSESSHLDALHVQERLAPVLAAKRLRFPISRDRHRPVSGEIPGGYGDVRPRHRRALRHERRGQRPHLHVER